MNLSNVVPSVSGPKRPQDRVSVSEMCKDFTECLTNKVLSSSFLLLLLSSPPPPLLSFSFPSFSSTPSSPPLLERLISLQVGFKGFGIPNERLGTRIEFTYQGEQYKLGHGERVHILIVITVIVICIVGGVYLKHCAVCDKRLWIPVVSGWALVMVRWPVLTGMALMEQLVSLLPLPCHLKSWFSVKCLGYIFEITSHNLTAAIIIISSCSLSVHYM